MTALLSSASSEDSFQLEMEHFPETVNTTGTSFTYQSKLDPTLLYEALICHQQGNASGPTLSKGHPSHSLPAVLGSGTCLGNYENFESLQLRHAGLLSKKNSAPPHGGLFYNSSAAQHTAGNRCSPWNPETGTDTEQRWDMGSSVSYVDMSGGSSVSRPDGCCADGAVAVDPLPCQCCNTMGNDRDQNIIRNTDKDYSSRCEYVWGDNLGLEHNFNNISKINYDYCCDGNITVDEVLPTNSTITGTTFSASTQHYAEQCRQQLQELHGKLPISRFDKRSVTTRTSSSESPTISHSRKFFLRESQPHATVTPKTPDREFAYYINPNRGVNSNDSYYESKQNLICLPSVSQRVSSASSFPSRSAESAFVPNVSPITTVTPTCLSDSYASTEKLTVSAFVNDLGKTSPEFDSDSYSSSSCSSVFNFPKYSLPRTSTRSNNPVKNLRYTNPLNIPSPDESDACSVTPTTSNGGRRWSSSTAEQKDASVSLLRLNSTEALRDFGRRLRSVSTFCISSTSTGSSDSVHIPMEDIEMNPSVMQTAHDNYAFSSKLAISQSYHWNSSVWPPGIPLPSSGESAAGVQQQTDLQTPNTLDEDLPYEERPEHGRSQFLHLLLQSGSLAYQGHPLLPLLRRLVWIEHTLTKRTQDAASIIHPSSLLQLLLIYSACRPDLTEALSAVLPRNVAVWLGVPSRSYGPASTEDEAMLEAVASTHYSIVDLLAGLHAGNPPSAEEPVVPPPCQVKGVRSYFRSSDLPRRPVPPVEKHGIKQATFHVK